MDIPQYPQKTPLCSAYVPGPSHIELRLCILALPLTCLYLPAQTLLGLLQAPWTEVSILVGLELTHN